MADIAQSVNAVINRLTSNLRVCDECNGIFSPRRLSQRFCKNSCNRTHFSRMQSRGGTLLPIAMAWRKTRGKAKDKLAEMCRLIDGWNFDDKKREEAHTEAVRQLKASKRAGTAT